MKRVYFIKPVGMEGPIKIGCSMSPDGRRETLTAWSPFALEIIAEIDGDFELERRFHSLFIETHQRREWFGWSNRIASVLESINDGTFDPASLPEPMQVAHLRFGKPNRVAGNVVWSPERRFWQAHCMRAATLRRYGMDWAEFCADARSYRQCHATPVDYRKAETHINAVTAKHAPRLKSIHYTGHVVPLQTVDAA